MGLTRAERAGRKITALRERQGVGMRQLVRDTEIPYMNLHRLEHGLIKRPRVDTVGLVLRGVKAKRSESAEILLLLAGLA